jgi:hypothetical protein
MGCPRYVKSWWEVREVSVGWLNSNFDGLALEFFGAFQSREVPGHREG